MVSDQVFADGFAAAPVMAILRGYSPERTLELAQRAWDVGIQLVEIPVQDAAGAQALALVVEAGRRRGRVVGAGTVVSVARVHAVAAAGVQFLVSPGIDPVVVRAGHDAGLAILPGVATATEVQLAHRLGLTWLKAFPASVLTPAWITAMHGPFPATRFVATGGISATDARSYLDAGAAGVAVGSALEDPAQLDRLAEALGRP